MPDENGPFFVTGGTLPVDAPSYVERQADRALSESLAEGHFCYVLNTRQMGKSSLIVRTAKRLRDAGHVVAALDLTATGQNVTPEQWYDGLLLMLGSQLRRSGGSLGRCDRVLQSCWQAYAEMGPMQRFFAAIETVLLPGVDKSLVVFIDEIDAVRSLPFSADEFFAGIRECFNRRVREPAFQKLTFCLVGVATPADLISDTRISPFNIGRRILLTDFTEREAEPLASGARGGLPILKRVLYWTNGHPYLTQRLLAAAAEEGIESPSAVDALCERIFLTKAARETDDNLSFVRNRLLRSGMDLGALLDLYRKVRSGRRIRDDETNPLCATLRLSGVVTEVNGLLRVRNRIYDHVFDQTWIESHLPGAERRRQRAAYLRGVSRATAIGTAVVIAVGGLAILAVWQAGVARYMEQVANERLSKARMVEGMQYLDQNDPLLGVAPLTDALRLDQIHFPDRVPASRLRLAFARLRCPRVLYSLDLKSPILWAERSPDGKRFVIALQNGIAQVWDSETGKTIGAPMQHAAAVGCAAFSPEGARIATASEEGTARIWDAQTGLPLTPPLRYLQHDSARRVDWSPGGRWIAVSGPGGTAIWDAATGKEQSRIWDTDTGHPSPDKIFVMETRAAAFAPDERRVAFVADSYLSNFANPIDGKMNGVIGTCFDGDQIRFSRDGKRILIAGVFARNRRFAEGQGACLLDGITGKPIAVLSHNDRAKDACFSSNGKWIATGARDGTACLWEAVTGKPMTQLLLHDGSVNSVRFSDDDRQMITAASDGTARIWDTLTGRPAGPILRHSSALRYAAFLDGPERVLTVGGDGVVKVWALAARGQDNRRIAAFDREPQKHRVIKPVSGADSVRISTFIERQAVDVRVLNLATGATLFPPSSLPLRGAFFESNAAAEFVYLTEPLRSGGSMLRAWSMRINGFVLEIKEAVQSFREIALPGPNGERAIIVDYLGGTQNECQAFSLKTGRALSPRFDRTREYFLLAQRRLVPFHKGQDPPGFITSGSGAIRISDQNGQSIALWNARTNAFAEIPMERRALFNMEVAWFSPDERLVLIKGRQTHLWDAEKAVPLSMPFTNSAPVTCAAFSSDGRLLATGTEEGVVQVRDVASGRVVLPPLLHRGTVRRVLFDPTGQWIATVVGNGAAEIWNARTGERVSPLLEQEGGIQTIFFNQAGDALVTGGDAEVRVWPLAAAIPSETATAASGPGSIAAHRIDDTFERFSRYEATDVREEKLLLAAAKTGGPTR